MIHRSGSRASGDDPVLLAEIVDRIRRRGPIPFDDFMGLALYQPAVGYYEKGAEAIGPEGDYYTSTELSRAFGETLSEQILEFDRLLGETPFDLVELGAGKGTMAADILARIEECFPGLYARLTYWLVERSAGMRAAQRRILERHACAGKVRWATAPDEVRTEGISGCVLANEFYDALPVRVVARRGETLYERRVGLGGDPPRPAWVEAVAEDPELLAYADRYALAPVDGVIAEAGLAAVQWTRRVARSIRRGFHLVIDYGDEAGRLYDARLRPGGTLLGYHRHRVEEDPLRRIGNQDLTAHVNFTAVAQAGREEGLEPLGSTTQDRFLVALGLASRIAGLASSSDPTDIRERGAMMELIHPEKMGRIFRVLIQARGVGAPRLAGLADPFASVSGRSLAGARARPARS